MRKAFWIIFTILFLAVAGAAAYYYYNPAILDKAKQYLGITEPVKDPAPPVIEIGPKKPKNNIPTPIVTDTLKPMELEQPNEMTDELAYFDGEEETDFLTEEDEMLLGKWQSSINEHWFRVYTDEAAEDGYYWGYEWNEDEDVHPEDLNKYGNGWFKWKKRGNKVLEFATADNNGQLIPYPYTITKLFYTELSYKEIYSNKKQYFHKVTE